MVSKLNDFYQRMQGANPRRKSYTDDQIKDIRDTLIGLAELGIESYIEKKRRKNMKNLYLDIDGVILTKKGVAAEHVTEFLDYVTEHFNCYWLTTHCDGNATTAFLYLVGKLSPEAVSTLEKIKPTKWKLWKPEGIDFTKDFFWLDDCAFEGDRKVLEEHQASDKLITVDLHGNPNQLLELINSLEG